MFQTFSSSEIKFSTLFHSTLQTLFRFLKKAWANILPPPDAANPTAFRELSHSAEGGEDFIQVPSPPTTVCGKGSRITKLYPHRNQVTLTKGTRSCICA